MLLDDAKLHLRISIDAFDSEINDLIDAAKDDLKLAGIQETKLVDTDPLIKRAIISYVKSNFGYDNKDSDKFNQSYLSLKKHLLISSNYIEVI